MEEGAVDLEGTLKARMDAVRKAKTDLELNLVG